MTRDPMPARLAFATRLAGELTAKPHSENLGDSEADAAYAIAYNEFARGAYESAFELFRTLSAYRPANKTYTLGAVLCLHRLRRYEAAIAGYTALSVMDPSDPAHLLACAECQLLAQQRPEAARTLEQVIGDCADLQAHAPIRARAQAMLELLRSHHEQPAAA